MKALLGTWDVKTEDGGREFVFEFSMKENKLAGKFTGGSGTSEMANLTFEKQHREVLGDRRQRHGHRDSAIVAEDKLSGMLSLQYGEAGITGTRRKEMEKRTRWARTLAIVGLALMVSA